MMWFSSAKKTPVEVEFEVSVWESEIRLSKELGFGFQFHFLRA